MLQATSQNATHAGKWPGLQSEGKEGCKPEKQHFWKHIHV